MLARQALDVGHDSDIDKCPNEADQEQNQQEQPAVELQCHCRGKKERAVKHPVTQHQPWGCARVAACVEHAAQYGACRKQ
ncbi:hypothetical protein D3C80_1463600 [compost metagenome]